MRRLQRLFLPRTGGHASRPAASQQRVWLPFDPRCREPLPPAASRMNLSSGPPGSSSPRPADLGKTGREGNVPGRVGAGDEGGQPDGPTDEAVDEAFMPDQVEDNDGGDEPNRPTDESPATRQEFLVKCSALSPGDFEGLVAHPVTRKPRPVFGLLDGEEAMVWLGKKQANVYLSRVISKSPDRVEPHCALFGNCGGCSLQHVSPKAQCQLKLARLLFVLREVGVEPRSVLPTLGLSPPTRSYRRRARLGGRYRSKERVVEIGFRKRSFMGTMSTNGCQVLDPRLGSRDLLMELERVLGTMSVPHKIPSVEVSAADEGAAFVFRFLSPPSKADLLKLLVFGRTWDLHVYVQTGGPNTVITVAACLAQNFPEVAVPVLPPPSLVDRMYVLGREVVFTRGPLDFGQVNGSVNVLMVNAVVEELRGARTVVDAFCGAGNFSIAAAVALAGGGKAGDEHVEVFGLELDKTMVEHAKQTAVANGVDGHCQFRSVDLFKRFNDESGEVAELLRRPSTVVVLDPPRSGAGAFIASCLSGDVPSRVVYVSCNADSFATDAASLVQKGFVLESIRLVDMFPDTLASESIAVFSRVQSQ